MLPAQQRASTLKRCTAALALAGFSIATTLAQAPSPQKTESSQPSAASAENKPISETLSKRQRQDAEDAYLAGARLLDRKDLAGAEAQFAKALKLNPGNRDYALAASLAHEQHITELVQQAGKARLMARRKRPTPCWRRLGCWTPKTV